ncbi:MAG: hypothetical protein HOC28_05405 [Bacteroidetes Order II. Incertae sedis bacterium]|jgi:hypothetical protein|nr:hypothetical protein [Bacteroidetes Order II. bacterium]MBT4602549.1 hypothetical protein [Bacteroidetes Order II. bacterium]MBT5249134.1 hypothetical protein [Bacteroidetes Order II. bacterium]MBT6199496.1 hypothetical protein [Bacteroidetes Order II. bacterium]MBT6424980.1 hypothetical protein [Bacteroidetes Order II. bacterium]
MKALLPVCTALLLLSACTNAETPANEAEMAQESTMAAPDALNPSTPNLSWPGDWQFQADSPSDEMVVTADTNIVDPDVYFTNMTPGWHVTMRQPRGIFWHPGSRGEGDYFISSNMFLFDPGTRNEGYGLFLGGSNLADENQEYLYFLLRRSGQFLIKLRNGAETSEVVGWTAHEAITAWTDESEGMIENLFGVQTEGDTISFSINGQTVHSMEKGDLPTDGLVGFRMNHGVNAHISSFDVTPAWVAEAAAE